MNEDALRNAEEVLSYRFKDRSHLAHALTHASLVDSRLHSNERMEFLGDAVLGMVVCEYLYRNYGDLLEGDLTKIKSTVVSRQCCAVVAEELGLGELLRLGKGMSNRPSLPRSVVAAVFESLVGAIFLDGGLQAATDFILQGLEMRIERAARSGHQYNFKSVLQQAVQQHVDATPQYLVLDEKGPDHAKCFEVCVEIGDRRFESCWGSSKKQAEQDAALRALLELNIAKRLESGEIRILPPEEATFPDG